MTQEVEIVFAVLIGILIAAVTWLCFERDRLAGKIETLENTIKENQDESTSY